MCGVKTPKIIKSAGNAIKKAGGQVNDEVHRAGRDIDSTLGISNDLQDPLGTTRDTLNPLTKAVGINLNAAGDAREEVRKQRAAQAQAEKDAGIAAGQAGLAGRRKTRASSVLSSTNLLGGNT